jgi:nucleoside-diphosphate-sugar epimerase
VLSIAERIRDALGGEIPIEAKGIHDARSYRVSSAKIRRALGFEPRLGIEEAVADLRAAYERGEIGDPAEARYHNIKWLKERASGR